MAPRIDLGDITHHNVNILKLINQKVFPVNYNVRWALLVLFLFFQVFRSGFTRTRQRWASFVSLPTWTIWQLGQFVHGLVSAVI